MGFVAISCHLWYIIGMELGDLIRVVGDEPVFETSLLLAGDVDPCDVRRQLSRWTSAGRLYQLRRGLYALAPPYQKVKPHPFVSANRMVRGSYVSCQSARALRSHPRICSSGGERHHGPPRPLEHAVG